MARLGRAFPIRPWLSKAPPTTAITFDAASNSAYQTAQATYSWSHATAGNSRYLVVGISMLSVAGSSVSGITYNGVALSLLKTQASVSGAVRVELWGLVAPATGSNTIAVTLSAALDSIGGAVSFVNVNQSSPTESANSNTATNIGAADATVTVTTVADNDWVIDVVGTDDTSITVGSAQTSRSNVSGTLGSGAMATTGPQTPAGAVAMSWTNVGALATWSIAGIALRALGGALTYNQTISVTGAGAVTLVKSVGKIVSLSGVGAVSLVNSVRKVVSAAGNGAVSLSRSVGKVVSVSGSGAVSISKAIATTLSLSGTGAVSIIKAVATTIRVTGNSATAIVKSVGKIVSVTGSSAVSFVKAVAIVITAVATGNVVIVSTMYHPGGDDAVLFIRRRGRRGRG